MQLADKNFFTVSEINTLVRSLIEEHYPEVAVLGEVSNFKRHSSGHLYFTLKDAASQLRAVCFRGDAMRLKTDVGDGQKVVVRGRLTLYEGYGQFQLVVRDIEEAGEGELEKAYKKLLDKLHAEGLFDEEHKKELPPFPERIAVVTSPTGAAVQDVLTTLGRRWPYAVVVVVPVHVQGDQAAPEIVVALESLERLENRPDLIILGRGGGSLEDLWAFNEEAVARAIFKCTIPVVSAVGHETDFTIADFVADVRAATPTMAAELAVPVHQEVQNDVEIKIKWLLDHINTMLREKSGRLNEMLRSYALGRVRGKIENLMQKTDYSLDKLQRLVGAGIKDRRSVLDREVSRLSALNPKNILTRGYTICSSASTGEILRGTAAALDAGTMKVTFHDGKVLSEVKEKINDG